ncbi:hypothetical protein ACA910_009719 [Epithemia clementina (nom. ined.)]
MTVTSPRCRVQPEGQEEEEEEDDNHDRTQLPTTTRSTTSWSTTNHATAAGCHGFSSTATLCGRRSFLLWQAWYQRNNEAAQLVQIALPTVLMRFSLVWIVPRTAAAVGKQLGSVALAGFSLGSVVGHLTCLSLMEGSLTAADTFVPRAFGAHNYREVARLVIRATCVGAFLLSLSVLPLWFGSQWILETILLSREPQSFVTTTTTTNDNDHNNNGNDNQDENNNYYNANYNYNVDDYYYNQQQQQQQEQQYGYYQEEVEDRQIRAAVLAQVWVRIYLAGAPANLLFRVLARFLLAQQKPWALVVSSLVPALLWHDYWMSWLIPQFGFAGSAWSLVATQWTMLFTLLTLLGLGSLLGTSQSSTASSSSSSSTTTTVCQSLTVHPQTWPQLDSTQFWRESCEWPKVVQYASLAVGGVLSFSEWWFAEIMTVTAGQFGVESLDAHTIAYNLVQLLFMIPLGVGMGLAVRMGHLIAAGETLRAKSLAIGCAVVMSFIGLAVAVILFLLRYRIIALFTKSYDITALSLVIWPYFCFHMFLIHVMGISSSILRALGLQWRAAGITFITLYCITLPAVLYFAAHGGGLLTQWKVVPVCYVGLQIALVLGYAQISWEELEPKPAEEQQLSQQISQQLSQQQHSNNNNNTRLKKEHEENSGNDDDASAYSIFRDEGEDEEDV